MTTDADERAITQYIEDVRGYLSQERYDDLQDYIREDEWPLVVDLLVDGLYASDDKLTADQRRALVGFLPLVGEPADKYPYLLSE